jgi:hypothetical protein
MDIAGVRTELQSAVDGVPVAVLAGHVERGNAAAAELTSALDGTQHQGAVEAVLDIQRATEVIEGVRARLAIAANHLTDVAPIL